MEEKKVVGDGKKFCGKINETRLMYNCAHLRSTKETLTIEYFRVILEEKNSGENFLG